MAISKTKTVTTIDEYIATFPASTALLLEKMRIIIGKAAPKAKESINYGIPTYKQEGNLVHFGGFKNHIGFYPAPSGIEDFKKELSIYLGAKGSVRFPLDKPLPASLITKIVRFRVKQNEEKASLMKGIKITSKSSGNMTGSVKKKSKKY